MICRLYFRKQKHLFHCRSSLISCTEAYYVGLSHHQIMLVVWLLCILPQTDYSVQLVIVFNSLSQRRRSSSDLCPAAKWHLWARWEETPPQGDGATATQKTPFTHIHIHLVWAQRSIPLVLTLEKVPYQGAKSAWHEADLSEESTLFIELHRSPVTNTLSCRRQTLIVYCSSKWCTGPFVK